MKNFLLSKIITFPQLASFSGKGRKAGVCISTFFKGFATTRAKKNLRGASAVILFSGKIFQHFLKSKFQIRYFGEPSFFMKFFSKTNPPLGVDLSPYQAKVYLKNLSKLRLLPQSSLHSSPKDVTPFSDMVCLYNFAGNGLFLP